MKTILFSILFALGLFSPMTQALTLSRWQNASLKISSFPCRTESPRFQGSGLLFSFGDQLYVLTSEHVLIQDRSSATCQVILDTQGKSLTALELLAADFTKGLALLRISKPTADLQQRAIPWNELTSATPATTVAAVGYPAGSRDLVTRTDGKLLTSQSTRSLIAGIGHLIETQNLPVEYGMSGGSLLSQTEDDFQWSGLLSHQILKREAGQPTTAAEIKEGTVSPNDLSLSIPGAVILPWIEQQLLNPALSAKNIWRRNPQAQIADQEALQYGPLLFTLKTKRSDEILGVGGILHGGSDASGVGGDDEAKVVLPPAEQQVIEVSFLPNTTTAEKSAQLDIPELEKWRQWLLAGRKVQWVFLSQPASRRLVQVQSLSQMLTLWLRDGYRPVVIRSQNSDLQAQEEILIYLARQLESKAQNLLEKTTDAKRRTWLVMIRDYAVMSENAMLTSKEWQDLQNGSDQSFWLELYGEDFETANDLGFSINKLVEQMQRMGL